MTTNRRITRLSRQLAKLPKPAQVYETAPAPPATGQPSAPVTVAWVVQQLLEVIDRSMQRKHVTDAEGNFLGDFKSEPAVANRALELLGQHLGMFMNKNQVTVTDTTLIEHKQTLDRIPLEV